METTCRQGAVALGAGDALVAVLPFDAARRHATQVVARLDELMRGAGLRPADIQEIYVSCGPGSYTGTRVGVTVARTLTQAVGAVRCVSVPTVAAVAQNLHDAAELRHLAVVLDARRGLIYVARFDRLHGRWVQQGQARTTTPAEFLAAEPARPLHLAGEGLWYVSMQGAGVQAVDESLWLPKVESVWRVGRQLAQAGHFTDLAHLRPIYTGKPEAIRLWDQH